MFWFGIYKYYCERYEIQTGWINYGPFVQHVAKSLVLGQWMIR